LQLEMLSSVAKEEQEGASWYRCMSTIWEEKMHPLDRAKLYGIIQIMWSKPVWDNLFVSGSNLNNIRLRKNSFATSQASGKH
jgi:hypothetical protein